MNPEPGAGHIALRTSEGPAAPHVDVLDGLRGLAIALVLMCHLQEYIRQLWSGASAFGASGFAERLVQHLWVGVDLFYVLSGFFIASAVLRSTVFDPMHFAKRRVTRVIPAYYIALLLTLLLLDRQAFANAQGWANLGLHLLMLHQMQPWSMYGIIGPAWTLGIEWSFYLAMLALASFWRMRSGWWLVLLFMVISYVWRGGVMVGVEPEQRAFWAVQFPGALDEFALGMLVAWLRQHGLWSRLRERWPGTGWALLILGLASVLACLVYYVSLLSSGYFSFPFAVVFSRTWLSTGFALMLAGFLVLEPSRALGALVRWTGLGALGRMSFSVYLYHGPVILLLHRSGQTWITDGPLLALVLTALSLLAGWVSYRWVEMRWHPSA